MAPQKYSFSLFLLHKGQNYKDSYTCCFSCQFLSPSFIGGSWIRTVNLWVMRQVFYQCTTTTGHISGQIFILIWVIDMSTKQEIGKMSFSQYVLDPKSWRLKNTHFHIFCSTKAQTIKILTRITFLAIFFH